MGGHHGAGHSGGAIFTAPDRDRQVAPAAFSHVVRPGQVIQLLVGQTHRDLPAQDGDSSGNRARFADGSLQRPCYLQILGAGQAVGDEGAFQGYHRSLGLEGGFDFRVDDQLSLPPRWVGESGIKESGLREQGCRGYAQGDTLIPDFQMPGFLTYGLYT